MDFDKLKQTDFWNFFNLSETGREQNKWGGTIVHLQTGGFQEHITLSVTLDKTGRLCGGKLTLANAFVGDAKHLNPFAKDITKSFITLFQFIGSTMEKLARGIDALNGTHDEVISIGEAPPPVRVTPLVQSMLDVYIGKSKSEQLVQEAGYVNIKRDETSMVLEIFYELLV